MARPVFAALGLLLATTPVAAQRTAFVDVNVVSVDDGRILPRQTVLVDDGRIARVGAMDSVAIGAGVRRLDGHGRFLIPGLFDTHAHFARPEDFDLYLANGVTTVQLLNAATDLRPWADSLRRDLRRGPSVTLCKGPIDDVPDSAAAVRVLDAAQAEGFGCIKLYDRIALGAYQALIDGARSRGIRALGHIPRNLTWEQAIAARPDAIAHAEEFLYSPITTAAAIDTIVSAMLAGNIALIATLTNYDLIGRQLVELPELLRRPELAEYSPVHRRAWGPKYNRYATHFDSLRVVNFRRLLAFQRDLVRRLDSAGVVVLAGTDALNNFVIPGYSLHDELEQLVLAGLRPAAALRAATSAAARSLGEAGRPGTVTEGAAADLVLIDGDPLRDITNTRLIAGVMRGGHWYPRAELRAWLDTLRARFSFEQRVMDEADRRGVPAALALVDAEQRHAGRPPLGVFALNELGWQYARLEATPRWDDARLVFEANARLYPSDPIATGSLAEFRDELRRRASAKSGQGNR
jgi:imidazolonepropionase-like amidohydrolase